MPRPLRPGPPTAESGSCFAWFSPRFRTSMRGDADPWPKGSLRMNCQRNTGIEVIQEQADFVAIRHVVPNGNRLFVQAGRLECGRLLHVKNLAGGLDCQIARLIDVNTIGAVYRQADVFRVA